MKIFVEYSGIVEFERAKRARRDVSNDEEDEVDEDEAANNAVTQKKVRQIKVTLDCRKNFF